MREILFRGKSKDNGEWVEGSLIAYADGDCFICCEELKDVLNKYQIDSKTVGQYTGLKDKNFKMIFEGDIVEYHEGIAKITWEETEALFGIKQDNDVRDFNSYWGQDLEVIGNIHDNPELLKGEE